MKSLPIQPLGTQPAIGRRLRDLRQQRRLTMEQVAEFTGLTKGFLSRVERDLTSPSVTSLVALCQVLGVPPGEVLDSAETALVRLQDAPRVSLGGEGITEQLVTPPGQRELRIIRAVVAPGGCGEADLYTMDCSVESLHVIEGPFVLVMQDGDLDLRSGDTVTFPGTEPHSWRNPGDRAAVVLWILAGHRAR
ncbi:helix-turn-helix domain-containing protein [Cellulosimicrobium funkei]|nr:helix-turn-helix domain-containing protein [Cellulosimicrobium funkei]